MIISRANEPKMTINIRRIFFDNFKVISQVFEQVALGELIKAR